MTASRYDVFLSHSAADKPAVEELAHRLRAEGVAPFLDKWHLVPGGPWMPALEEALDASAACAVFIGPSGLGPWQHEEMRAAIDRRVRDGGGAFRVIPVLLPGGERGPRSRLPAFLAATTWVEFRRGLDDADAFRRLLCGVRGTAPGPDPEAALAEGQCPYRGLEHFDVEHAPFFCGREALTSWLLDKLRPAPRGPQPSRFLAVVGASGSGKSSLARAGLVAALRRGAIEGSAGWPVAVCRPGADPLESLAVALARGAPLGADPSAVLKLMAELRRSEKALHVGTRLALHNAEAGRRLVLLVDQFEELFTLCTQEKLRRAFLGNLLYAAQAAQGQTLVVLTLRADFYGKCGTYPELATALADSQLLVGPMTEEELRGAIERPARLVGCEFEPGLVERLLRDVQDQPGGLPLLQHALLELWNRREGRRLTLAAYEAVGGVAGALQRRADAVYETLSEAQQEICRRIFLRLTQPGEGTEDTKRRVPLRELEPAEGDLAEVEAVVNALTESQTRLVTAQAGEGLRGERCVEVAHEALIRGWSRLRGWIEADRAALRTQRRLTEAANLWDENGRDRSFLYHGARLAAAREWAPAHAGDLNPLEKEFLSASSQAEEQRRADEAAQARRLMEETEARLQAETVRAQQQAKAARRLRQRAWALAGVGLIAVALGGTALVLLVASRKATQRAEESRDLALESLTNMASAIGQELTGRPELRSLHERLLQNARQDVHRLARAAETSPGVNDRAVWIHFQLGNLFLSLDEPGYALKQYRLGQRIAQALATADPTSGTTQRQLAVSYNKLGDAQLALGDAEAAHQAYQKGLEITRKLADAGAQDTAARHDLAASYSKLGDACLALGDRAAARRAYGEGVAIARVLAADPADFQAQLNLVKGFCRQGNLELESCQFAEALSWYQRARTSLRQIAARENLQDQPRLVALGNQVDQAITDCEATPKAVADVEFALRQPPPQANRLLVLRAKVLLRRGLPAEAAVTAVKLRGLAPDDPVTLYNVACCYALCVSAVAPGKKAGELGAGEKALRQQYDDQAITILREAIRKGYKDLGQLKRDPDLNALRGREDFKKLTRELGQGPPTAPDKVDKP